MIAHDPHAEPAPLHDAAPKRERLHPLSPIMRGSRTAIALVVVLVLGPLQHSSGRDDPIIDAVVVVVVVLLGLVHWYVTWWSFDGTTLTVETGLLRRDVRKLPVVRIQSVDIVQPLLGKFLNVAELRIRTAGTGKGERLAYLHHERALELQAILLATHHGLDASTPAPEELPLAVVSSSRLAWAVALSGPTVLLIALLAGIGIISIFSERTGAKIAIAGLVYLFGLVTSIWRRFNGQYGFTVATAPDGIRVRRGLLGTVAETIPTRRVQAIRQVEPLVWQPMHWARLEVDLAGVVARDSSAGPRSMSKTLLPVGPTDVVAMLRGYVVAPSDVTLTRPPSRVRWKAPISYHNLAAGHDATMAVATTGRLGRATCWVPLEKVQSVRRVQGPLQRLLGVASVHLDVAGRRTQAAFTDRGVEEADALVEDLTVLCREARSVASLASASSAATPGTTAHAVPSLTESRAGAEAEATP